MPKNQMLAWHDNEAWGPTMSFNDLLCSLAAEHDREVAELRMELLLLKAPMQSRYHDNGKFEWSESPPPTPVARIAIATKRDTATPSRPPRLASSHKQPRSLTVPVLSHSVSDTIQKKSLTKSLSHPQLAQVDSLSLRSGAWEPVDFQTSSKAETSSTDICSHSGRAGRTAPTDCGGMPLIPDEAALAAAFAISDNAVVSEELHAPTKLERYPTRAKQPMQDCEDRGSRSSPQLFSQSLQHCQPPGDGAVATPRCTARSFPSDPDTSQDLQNLQDPELLPRSPTSKCRGHNLGLRPEFSSSAN